MRLKCVRCWLDSLGYKFVVIKEVLLEGDIVYYNEIEHFEGLTGVNGVFKFDQELSLVSALTCRQLYTL